MKYKVHLDVNMRKMFNCEVGLSDHSLGIGVAVGSVALGATVIEKHLTLARNDEGVDSAFSMEPDEMRSLVVESKRAWQSKGTINYGPTDSEIASRKYRRSLYIVKDIKKGQKITRKNMRAIRPGLGLPTKYYNDLLGKEVKKNLSKGTPIDWSLIK